jgi:ABC-2 type transport system permease protein
MKRNGAMWAIVRTELQRRRLYLLWWSIGIIALLAFTVLAYGSVRDQAAELNKAFGSLSSSISSFVGTGDMFSPVGYLNSQLYFITLPILFILLSVTLAGSLLNKEENNRTLELLLARPISRTHVLIAKAISGCVVMALLGVVSALTIIVCGWAVHLDIPIGYLLLTTAAMVVFSGAFGALAFMLYAASNTTRRLAVVGAILFSFGGYILSSIAGLVHGLVWIAKLFPYHYYDPGAMLTGRLSLSLVAYIGAIYVISLVIAVVGFRRRDIG